MTRIFLLLFALFSVIPLNIIGQQNKSLLLLDAEDAIVGASRTEEYIDMIRGKRVGVVGNQTSIFHGVHLVDTLLNRGIDIERIFTPEHGFRGTADEGASVASGYDERTGIQIVSLYGKNKKPTREQLEGLDILLFDLQDVGTRFYTYISTMTYVMEAAAENGVPVIVLDRPNPNGFYVDGPVLDESNTSFVGMHRVPIVYGLTIGEYATMVNGEKWLKDSINCELTVIKMGKYIRDAIYKLPVKPSPNLPNWESVYLYPSLCLFEGTDVSVGRGTVTPFQVYGHPDMSDDFVFTPETAEGHRPPLYSGEKCHGKDLTEYAHNYSNNEQRLNLSWIIDARKQLAEDEKFFNNYFIKLAGVKDLQEKIDSGMSEDEIRSSWRSGIEEYLKIRAKYLIY
ncbi:MAG: exo-beta-N-acetylmuramidase NamZ domain-containing protein [Candidatus Limimorpha sp.]